MLSDSRRKVVSGPVQRAAVTQRYEALLRVSQTLLSVRSSEELFSILARELRAVVNFYVMGVGIYDEKAHEMHTTSYGEPGAPLEAPKFAPEETFSWWVYQHQQPLIIPSLDAESRFPAVAEMLKNRGVRSVCVLPLTTVHRRLGGLAMGSTEADAYSEEEVSFLSLVANQVALAVDDALNFEALQNANEALHASEHSFRLIVDSIPGLINTTTAEGEFEFVSQQCIDYFGMTVDELKDWATSGIVHPDDLSRVQTTWRRAVETGQPYESEYRIRRADGVYRWFHVRSLPWRDTKGRIIRWYSLRTDIEDRKRAEEALRASEQGLRLIVDSIPGLVNTRTAGGEVEFVGQQTLDYFGKTLDELKGWAISGIAHPDDASRILAAWRRSIETGQPYDSEYRLRRGDGVYRWFHVRALPWRDAGGHIIRWYVLHTDIDERKQAEDRLQLLFDVTNQVVSNLQLRDLLRSISGNIRRVMQCDCASLALPYEENKQLRLYVLDFPEGKGFIHEEGLYPIEGSPYGTAFRTMKPLALDSTFAGWLDSKPVASCPLSGGIVSSVSWASADGRRMPSARLISGSLCR